MLNRRVKERIEANRNRRSLPNWRKALIRDAAKQVRTTDLEIIAEGARTRSDGKRLDLLYTYQELLLERIRALHRRRTSRRDEAPQQRLDALRDQLVNHPLF